jgi:hypothetical protein
MMCLSAQALTAYAKGARAMGKTSTLTVTGEPVSGHLDDLSYTLSLSKQPDDLKVAAFDGISCISALSQYQLREPAYTSL